MNFGIRDSGFVIANHFEIVMGSLMQTSCYDFFMLKFQIYDFSYLTLFELIKSRLHPSVNIHLENLFKDSFSKMIFDFWPFFQRILKPDVLSSSLQNCALISYEAKTILKFSLRSYFLSSDRARALPGLSTNSLNLSQISSQKFTPSFSPLDRGELAQADWTKKSLQISLDGFMFNLEYHAAILGNAHRIEIHSWIRIYKIITLIIRNWSGNKFYNTKYSKIFSITSSINSPLIRYGGRPFL